MPRAFRTEQAQRDLEEILDYLDQQGEQTADRFAAKFDGDCELHADHPGLGAPAEEFAPGLRHFAVWNYAIFYQPVPDGIEIIRIIHGARDLPRFFGD